MGLLDQRLTEGGAGRDLNPIHQTGLRVAFAKFSDDVQNVVRFAAHPGFGQGCLAHPEA
jgi:hypothetical protein